jgi:pyruvate formate lyase activating enzyme
MKTVEADIPFYKNSGGGLTCSGGEPMLQYKFVSELLRAAKEKGIHTALDTAGCVPFESYDSVLPYVDLLLIDLKVMDDAIHKKCTGVSNSRILANIEAINANYDNEIWIRIPVIPTVNDNDANMSASAAFLKRLQHVSRVELLPYHNLGVGKYESLGRGIDENAILKPPKKETMEQLAEHFNGLHFDVVVN